jgi:hypothetical protein
MPEKYAEPDRTDQARRARIGRFLESLEGKVVVVDGVRTTKPCASFSKKQPPPPPLPLPKFQSPKAGRCYWSSGWSTARDSAWDWIQLQGHNNINRHEWSMAGIALFYLHPWDKNIFHLLLLEKQRASRPRASNVYLLYDDAADFGIHT